MATAASSLACGERDGRYGGNELRWPAIPLDRLMQSKLDQPRVPKRKRPVLLRDEERYRLVGGPYEPPLVKDGFLVDALRGKVRFRTFSNALIPWPKFQREGKSGSGGLVLCGDLLRALEQESGPTICHYWGVSRATVGNWRRALEMKGMTPGAQRMVNLGVELAKLPESRQKIGDAARGRTLSAGHKSRFLGAMHRGWEERFKARRASYHQTGRFPQATKSDPWLPEEEKLLPQMSTLELVGVLGRTFKSIQAHRHLLGLRAAPRAVGPAWQEGEIQMLGTAPDRLVAQRLGRAVSAVETKRRTLGIPAASSRPWTPAEEAIIGKVADAEAARQLGRTQRAVQHRRLKLGMAFFHVEHRRKGLAGEAAQRPQEPHPRPRHAEVEARPGAEAATSRFSLWSTETLIQTFRERAEQVSQWDPPKQKQGISELRELLEAMERRLQAGTATPDPEWIPA